MLHLNSAVANCHDAGYHHIIHYVRWYEEWWEEDDR